MERTTAPEPHGRNVWKIVANAKDKKHTTASSKCQPFIVSTYGAVDPDAIKWMIQSLEEMKDLTPKNRKRILKDTIKKINETVWKYNTHMYKNHMYKNHLDTLGNANSDTEISNLPLL